jgi:vancomycin resistance protein YoaR
VEPRDPSETDEAQPQPTLDDGARFNEVALSPRTRVTGLPFGINRQHVVASFIMLLIVLAALGIGLGIYSSSHQNRIYDGVSVAGVELGGKTRSQARALLEPALAEFMAQPITLTSEGNSFTIDPAASGIAFDVDATVERAFSYGRSGNVVARFARWSKAILHGATINPAVKIDTVRLDATLSEVAQNVIVPPVNAAIVIAGEAGPAIATEWPGVGFDLTETRHLIARHMTSLSSESVPLVLVDLEPAIDRADLEVGFATAQVVITDGFLIRGPDRRMWQLDREDLRALLSFAADDGRLSINTEAITSLVSALAETIDREAVDATVFVNADEEVVVRRSIDARVVDQQASVESILDALRSGAGEAELTWDERSALIQTETAEAAATEIETLVADGIEINWGDGSERLSRRELIAALTITVEPEAAKQIAVGFDQTVLSSLITPVLAPLETDMRNARFRLVNGAVVVIEESQVGVTVDVPATVAATRQAVLAGNDRVNVTLTRVEPDFSSSDATSIQMNDQLASGSTPMFASTNARRANIARGAELIDGVMVAPGDSFSLLEALGEISQATGFELAFGFIYDPSEGGESGLIVGGGVSQIATTLFQAAFWAGLPIEERTAHPYWIEAYGQPPSGMVGLDALIDARSEGLLDFTFENATEGWIAVSIELTGTALNVSIQGTNPGWTVRADEPVITDRIELGNVETRVIETPELNEGVERTIEAGSDGFTVSITRTVIQGGTTVREDDFVSTYAPSPETVLRGSGGGSGSD